MRSNRRAPRAAGRRRHPHAGRDDGDLQAEDRPRWPRRRRRPQPPLPRVDARPGAGGRVDVRRRLRDRRAGARRRAPSRPRPAHAGPVPGGDVEAAPHGGRPRARRHDGPQPVRARASGLRRDADAVPLDDVRKDLYSPCRTYVRPPDPGEPDADDATTGDLAVPRRVRGRARLPADRTGDRRRRRARLPVDRSRPPREPRARRPAATRPDEASGDRARRAGAARRSRAAPRRHRPFLSSAGSLPVVRCSPSRRSRTRSPSPSRSAGTPTSSSASPGTR